LLDGLVNMRPHEEGKWRTQLISHGERERVEERP